MSEHRRRPPRPPRRDRRQPRHPATGHARRVRLPGHRTRRSPPGSGSLTRRADGRPAHPAGRDRGRAGPAGRAGRLRGRVRRPGLPPDARDLRRPRGPDRHAGHAGRRGARHRLAPPARLPRGSGRRTRSRRAARPPRAWRSSSDAQPLAPGPRAGRGGRARRGDPARDRGRPRRAADPGEHARRRRPRSTSGSGTRWPGRSTSRAPSRARCSRSSSSPTRSADFGVTGGDPRLRLPRRPLHGAVRGQVGDRRTALARSAELPGVAVPEELFAGVVGVAPSHERLERVPRARRAAARAGASRSPTRCRRRRCRPRRRRACGRSRRVRPAATSTSATSCAGSRLWLPVDVPGALFSIGDLHFAQGDGEVCGTAIEVAGAVTVRFALHDGPRRRCRATRRRRGRSRRSFATMGSRSRRGWT